MLASVIACVRVDIKAKKGQLRVSHGSEWFAMMVSAQRTTTKYKHTGEVPKVA
jgi:hypothetical protein